LLVGARRGFEREKLKKDAVFRRFMPALAGAEESKEPAFLVATSAGEVGIDLDADHLVCDLVAWERMVQRLGRVNRRADPGVSLVDVFVSVPDKDAEDEADLERLQQLRAPFEHREWESDKDGRRNASPNALQRLARDPELAKLAKRAS